MKLDEKAEARRRLNYLIVMPKIATSPGAGYSLPLGIAYISSSLKKAGFSVFTLNLNHYWDDIRTVLETKIKENNIDVVMTGGLSAQYNTIKPILEIAKHFRRTIITIAGGGIVTAEPDIAMEALEFADFGVIGEGELTIVELCTALENGNDFAEVNGLIFRTKWNEFTLDKESLADRKYQITAHRNEIMDLDSIPWPDYEGFELEKHLATSFSGNVTNGRNDCQSFLPVQLHILFPYGWQEIPAEISG